jgi:hypothetical protein
MRLVIFIILICCANIFPQKSAGSFNTTATSLSDSINIGRLPPPVFDKEPVIIEKDSGAVLIRSDRKVLRFSTIQPAIDSADANSTIMIYPGNYADSLTISTENISIVGISSKAVTISGSIYVTASTGIIENCRLSGNLSLTGHTVKALYYVKDCLLENNINVGTASIPIVSNCYFIDCLLGSDGAWVPRTIYINVSATAGGAPDIFFHQCFSPIWSNSHNFYLTGGYANVHIEGDTKIAFNSITINGGADITHTPMLFFRGCNLAIISLTLTGFTEISCLNSEVTFFQTTTISNNCEFDMFNCKINGAVSLDIIFNSTLPTRWTFCTGTAGIGHIMGSHLEKLHIQYSFFQQTAAPVGLGSDDANTWGVWTDQ